MNDRTVKTRSRLDSGILRLPFGTDPFPGRPKILFIGLGESTHTQSWIDLLESADFNVRLFALPSGVPPADWEVKTYLSAYEHAPLNAQNRLALHSANHTRRFLKRQVARLNGAPSIDTLASDWLARIIQEWRPDIIHTLGLDPAGNFYFQARHQHQLQGIGKWVLQTRGGSDLALSHLNPECRDKIAAVLRECDQMISDNSQNFSIARSMGVRDTQLSRIGTVPGTGGIEVAEFEKTWAEKPSTRRMILWPKVYETPWGKILPVFEAFKLCWQSIQPCEVTMLSMDAEARMWYWTLPTQIRELCHPSQRLARGDVLNMMARSRVMLAPSLVDGVPNSMLEAMAAGALPIVSPLETIKPVVEAERNVLFARNLYPQEIADALVRAMSDDALVDRAADENLKLVRRIADRSEIRLRVTGFYQELAG